MFVSIYIVIFLLVAILAVFEDSESEKNQLTVGIYAVFAIILFALAAFRPIGIDHDAGNYVKLFGGEVDADDTVEPSFFYIASAVKLIANDPRLLFVAYALLSVPLKAFAVTQLSKSWMLTLTVWMGFLFMNQDMTQIRVSVAAGIFMLMLPWLMEGRRWFAAAAILVATFFHVTAITLFMFLFLGNKPLGSYWRIALAAFPLLAFALHAVHFDPIIYIPSGYVQEKIEAYELLRDSGIMGDEINVFNIPFLMKLAVYYFILWRYDSIVADEPRVTILLKVFVVSICFFLLFSFFPVLAWRLSEIPGVVEIVLFPTAVYAFKQQIVGKLIVIVYALALLVQNVFVAQLLDLSM